jgi:hypothetical protein
MSGQQTTAEKCSSSVMKNSALLSYVLFTGLALTVWAPASQCQQASTSDPVQGASKGAVNNNPPEKESKHVLWLIPNYRTSPSLANYEPISVREKFKLASEDAFDQGTIGLAAIFAGQAQLTNANRPFGQGVSGYSKYFATAYGDFAIGDFMTEGIFPTLLHQDPRYFRRGTGSGWARLGYAMGQIFWTQCDSGRKQFNYSEVVGNSTAVAISEAYYSDNRTASEAVSSLGVQLGVDMAANILKEFWPDLERKFRRKHHHDTVAVDTKYSSALRITSPTSTPALPCRVSCRNVGK